LLIVIEQRFPLSRGFFVGFLWLDRGHVYLVRDYPYPLARSVWGYEPFDGKRGVMRCRQDNRHENGAADPPITFWHQPASIWRTERIGSGLL
jgi:hypothetical protein